MPTTVIANFILLTVVFISGAIFGNNINLNELVVFWKYLKKLFVNCWETFFQLFAKKFWYNRKLNKKGIKKQVLCLMRSYTSEGNHVPLVEYGHVYNVLDEVEGLNWGDAVGAYVMKEHGWNVRHSKAVFVDYYGGNIEKILKKQKNRIETLHAMFNVALERQEEIQRQKKLEEIKNFKFLK